MWFKELAAIDGAFKLYFPLLENGLSGVMGAGV